MYVLYILRLRVFLLTQKTRRTFFLYGRPAHFHSLKKAEISFRGRKHPVQGSFFSPPTPPELQLLFRHEVGNAVSSRVCGANSRSELRTDVQFRYRRRARRRTRGVCPVTFRYAMFSIRKTRVENCTLRTVFIRCRKAAGLASLQSKLELKNCTGTYSFSNP